VSRTVLIVDDHAGFRRFVRRLLESEGYRVVGEADDGESALVATRLLRPEVVLLDVLLPDTNGFALAELLVDEPDAPAVVLISSREADDFRGRLERSRVSGFIQKDHLSRSALATLVDGRR
jgi:DNA-binding NarL/FixJ family response regulator